MTTHSQLVQRLRAPNWMPSRRTWWMEPLALFITLAVITGVALIFALQWKGIIFVTAITVYCIVLALFVRWVHQKSAQFDQDLVPVLQTEDLARAQKLIENAWVVRWFGARAHVGRRFGLAAYMQSQWEKAEKYMEVAWLRSDPEARCDLMAPLCRIKYKLKRDDDMHALALDWVRLEQGAGPGGWYLALAAFHNQLGNASIETIVAEAGSVQDPIDEEARAEVFERMASRTPS